MRSTSAGIAARCRAPIRVAGDLNPSGGMSRIDVTRLRYGDESFDAVICNHGLEHVPDACALSFEPIRRYRG